MVNLIELNIGITFDNLYIFRRYDDYQNDGYYELSNISKLYVDRHLLYNQRFKTRMDRRFGDIL